MGIGDYGMLLFLCRHWVAVFGLTIDKGLRNSCVAKLSHLIKFFLKSKGEKH